MCAVCIVLVAFCQLLINENDDDDDDNDDILNLPVTFGYLIMVGYDLL